MEVPGMAPLPARPVLQHNTTAPQVALPWRMNVPPHTRSLKLLSGAGPPMVFTSSEVGQTTAEQPLEREGQSARTHWLQRFIRSAPVDVVYRRTWGMHVNYKDNRGDVEASSCHVRGNKH